MTDREEFEKLKQTFDDFIRTSSGLQRSYEELKEKSSQLSLYLSNILENMNSAILVFDNEFNLNLCNRRAGCYFPVLEEKDPPLKMSELQYGAVLNILQVLQNTGASQVQKVNISNRIHWLELIPSDFIDSRKSKVGYLLVINDITELKELQIKSQQEDRLRVMGELAAEVAHEIRNPLGSIELMVTLLEEEMTHGEKNSEILSRIRTSVNNMNHTVTNILLYTRNIQLKKSVFDVMDLIRGAESMVMDRLVKKEITIDKQISPCALEADFELLKQVLANLLLNAVDAVDPKGKIELETHTRNANMVIHIRDNGPGIPKEIQGKIFKPFFTTKNSGTGLGLAMTSRVLEAHAGTIRLESNKNGTLFIIEIPLK